MPLIRVRGRFGQVRGPVGVLPPYEPPSGSNQAAPGRSNYCSPEGPRWEESSYSDRVRRGGRVEAGLGPGAGGCRGDSLGGHLVRWRAVSRGPPPAGGFAVFGGGNGRSSFF